MNNILATNFAVCLHHSKCR